MTAQDYLNQLDETKIKLKKLIFENKLAPNVKLVAPPQCGYFFDFCRPAPSFLPHKAFPKGSAHMSAAKAGSKEEIVIEVF